MKRFFFTVKVVSNFHFEHFLEKWLQCQLVVKRFKKTFWPVANSEMFKGIKIVFCFDICLCHSEEKFVLVWFSFFPSYRSRKRGTEKKIFEAEAAGRSWEMFLRFPFFYWGNLGKTKIRRGQIFPKRVARTHIETECFFHFSGFFVA